MRWHSVLATGWLMWSTIAFAENTQDTKSFISRVSLRGDAYFYSIPGFYFDFSSVDKHPKQLNGYWTGGGIRYSLCKNDSCSIGLNGFTSVARGQGAWTRSSDLKKYNVDGAAIGVTSWRLSGGYLDFEKIFWTRDWITPYAGGGLGVGLLRAKFRGKFYGVELRHFIQIRGVPANDDVEQILPIVTLKLGVRFLLLKSLYLTPEGWIGTPGLGLGLNLEKRF